MSDIEFTTHKKVGIITLNRPNKLNALTGEMCAALDMQLKSWAIDDNVKAVFINGEGDRAFCAGGDISMVYHNGAEQAELTKSFFETEYTMNSTIFHYKKPYIAMMHGICMGGGLGVSIHGKFRVADPDATLAMPETGIGFFPDVGGSYFLSRMPGELGTYLGLTGARIGVDDAYYCGLVDCKLARDQFEEFILFVDDFKVDITSMILSLGQKFEEAPLAEHRSTIDECFAFDSVEKIFTALAKHKSEFAEHTLAQLEQKSPTSLALTLQQLRSAKSKSFDACMKMERRLVDFILHQQDFYEGVRAAVIDKDQNPRWSPVVEIPEEIL